MDIKEIRKLKAELETDILVLLRDFSMKTEMKIERIELLKMMQEGIGTKDYWQLVSVEIKTSL